MKRVVIGIVVAAFLSSPLQASNTYTGKISSIQIVDTGSMHLRVTLNTPMANCDLNFAFVEPSSTVFTLYGAGLLTAFSQQKDVSLQVSREASGYCRIFFAHF